MLDDRNNRFFFPWDQMFFLMQIIFIVLQSNMGALQNHYTLVVQTDFARCFGLHVNPHLLQGTHFIHKWQSGKIFQPYDFYRLAPSDHFLSTSYTWRDVLGNFFLDENFRGTFGTSALAGVLFWNFRQASLLSFLGSYLSGCLSFFESFFSQHQRPRPETSKFRHRGLSVVVSPSCVVSLYS